MNFHAIKEFFIQVLAILAIPILLIIAPFVLLVTVLFRGPSKEKPVSDISSKNQVPNDDPDIPEELNLDKFTYLDNEGYGIGIHADGEADIYIESTVPVDPGSLIDPSLDGWAVIERREEDEEIFGKRITEKRNNGVECTYSMNHPDKFKWLLSHDVVRYALDSQCWSKLRQRADEGDPEALSVLGSLLAHSVFGQVTPKVISIWESAAESGAQDAMRELAIYHWKQATDRNALTETQRDDHYLKAIYWNDKGNCHIFNIDRYKIFRQHQQENNNRDSSSVS